MEQEYFYLEDALDDRGLFEDLRVVVQAALLDPRAPVRGEAIGVLRDNFGDSVRKGYIEAGIIYLDILDDEGDPTRFYVGAAEYPLSGGDVFPFNFDAD